jgi:hypothetical protein
MGRGAAWYQPVRRRSRLSLGIGQRMRAHLNYRLNVAGNAAPVSGAAVTLAGDF